MNWTEKVLTRGAPARKRLGRPDKTTFIMVAIIAVLGAYLFYPVVLIMFLSFNTGIHFFVGERTWGFDNWRIAFADPRIAQAVWNTTWLWGVTMAASFPFGIFIAWLLARTKIPGSHFLEFFFWISYVTPGGLIAWIMLFDPRSGMANVFLEMLPFIDRGPFNIFSIWGIIFVNVIGGGVSTTVMILTPMFRNMDAAMEEAARVSGASALRTMVRVTIPIMISPIILLFALQLMRMFSRFEVELILGIPINFYVYSTLIFDMIRLTEPPLYGQATALAGITLIVVAAIIPMQRWILQRRRYTTITGNFKPGLVSLGPLTWVAFGFVLTYHFLDIFTLLIMVMGSFMTRVGFFDLTPVFTLDHWRFALAEPQVLTAFRTTLIIAFAGGIGSPLLFSVLAYIMVRTRWRFRLAMDTTIWVSGALPGFLSGLGLMLMFLWTPGLNFLYGTVWVLILVVIISGNTTGVNIMKGAIVQVGADIEEAARVSGAGWTRAYFTILFPVMMPTLALIGLFNFNAAANATSSIILLASRDTVTVSIVILHWLLPGGNLREEAAVLQLILGTVTLGTALLARHYAIKQGVRHR